MSWKVQALVAERVCGSSIRKMVMLNMAARANDDGTGVYAAIETMAGWCECDSRTVRRAIRELLTDGLITNTGKRRVKYGWVNEWAVSMEAVEALPMYRDEVAERRRQKAAQTPDTVSGVAKKVKKTKTISAGTAGVKSGVSESQGCQKVTPDAAPPLSECPRPPDTVSAKSIPEPIQGVSSFTNVQEDTQGLLVELPVSDRVAEAIALYAEAAQQSNWITPRGKPTAARRAAILARLRECGGLEGWKIQIELAKQMPFLGGDSVQGWRMDLDFFIRPSGWTAIAEGKYKRAGSAKRTTAYRNGVRPNPLIRPAT